MLDESLRRSLKGFQMVLELLSVYLVATYGLITRPRKGTSYWWVICTSLYNRCDGLICTLLGVIS